MYLGGGPVRQDPLPDWAAGGILTLVVLVTLSIGAPTRFSHWFVGPVSACGLLLAADTTRYLRGRVNLWDPRGLVGTVSYFFFFIAPLLHVRTGAFLLGNDGIPIAAPQDWRDWLGAAAMVNFIGILVYRLVVDYPRSRRVKERHRAVGQIRASGAAAATQRATKGGSPRCSRVVRVERLTAVFLPMITISALAELYVLVVTGGAAGYASAFRSRQFTNLGPLLLVGESFPVLLLLYSALLRRTRSSRLIARVPLGAIAIAVVAADALVMGLRGSRSEVVLVAFWSLGIYGFVTRRTRRRSLFGLVAVSLLAVFALGVYKSADRPLGADALDTTYLQELAQSSGRSPLGVLLGDLGRADIEARLLYGVQEWLPADYAWGRTVLGAIHPFIRFGGYDTTAYSVTRWGTDALYGRGMYAQGWRSSRNYGLVGEGILNLGAPGGILAFVLLAVGVSGIGLLRSRPLGDPLQLLTPLLTMSVLMFLLAGTGPGLYLLIKLGLLPWMAIMASSSRATAHTGEKYSRA